MNREHVLEAVAQVCTRLQKAGAHNGMWWAGSGTPAVTVLRPLDGRDDAQAIALAMDVGVDRGDLLVEADLVRGPVFIEDTWAPGPVRVDVVVQYGSGREYLHSPTPVAGIPMQRQGDVEVIEQDDARLAFLDHGTES